MIGRSFSGQIRRGTAGIILLDPATVVLTKSRAGSKMQVAKTDPDNTGIGLWGTRGVNSTKQRLNTWFKEGRPCKNTVTYMLTDFSFCLYKIRRCIVAQAGIIFQYIQLISSVKNIIA